MSKELDALEKLGHTISLAFNENNKAIFNKDQFGHNDCKDAKEFMKCYSIVEKELKEHEQLEKLLKNIFDKDSDLCLEDWTHYDGHHSYHIVVGEGEFLDIQISKEEYDLLVRYQNGKEES